MLYVLLKCVTAGDLVSCELRPKADAINNVASPVPTLGGLQALAAELRARGAPARDGDRARGGEGGVDLVALGAVPDRVGQVGRLSQAGDQTGEIEQAVTDLAPQPALLLGRRWGRRGGSAVMSASWSVSASIRVAAAAFASSTRRTAALISWSAARRSRSASRRAPPRPGWDPAPALRSAACAASAPGCPWAYCSWAARSAAA